MVPYLRWLVYLIANITMLLLAYLSAPLLPFFADKNGWLPQWLWWFQTPKYPITGNPEWRYQRRYWLNDPDVDTSPFKIWFNKVAWLWRNPSYGFDRGPIAFKASAYADHLIVGGDVETSEKHPGWVFRKLFNDDASWAWQLYIVHYWNDTHCLRINLGWKLWDYVEDLPKKLQFVCSISLWKNYQGK